MRHWIEAARIRTLPLSVSGIIVEVCMRWQIQRTHTSNRVFNWRIFSFAIITTLGLQILSILPMIMVTASKERITRIEWAKKGDSKRDLLQRNERSDYNYFFTLLSAILLIYFAFEDTNLYYSLFYLMLGI
jgi:1,4-dihydroxy-2-naphthoate octaprenyltransferase